MKFNELQTQVNDMINREDPWSVNYRDSWNQWEVKPFDVAGDYEFKPLDPLPPFQVNPWDTNSYPQQVPIPGQIGIDGFDPYNLPEHLRQYWDNTTIPRNVNGQPMYSPNCMYCTAHEEDVLECDLCDQRFTIERLHINASRKDWVDELVHECMKTKECLNFVLYAIIV